MPSFAPKLVGYYGHHEPGGDYMFSDLGTSLTAIRAWILAPVWSNRLNAETDKLTGRLLISRIGGALESDIVFVELIDYHLKSCKLGRLAASPLTVGGEPALEVGDGSAVTIVTRRLYFNTSGPGTSSRNLRDEPMPAESAFPVERLVESWRVCPRCAEAWQIPDSPLYAHCPLCQALTALPRVASA